MFSDTLLLGMRALHSREFSFLSTLAIMILYLQQRVQHYLRRHHSYFAQGFENATRQFSRLSLTHPHQSLYIRPHTSDLKVLTSIFIDKQYLPCFPLPYSPEFILDAGANIGLSTIWFARQFPQSTLIALEPDEANFNVCSKNCSGISRITVLRQALLGRSGQASIIDEDVQSWAKRVRLDPDATPSREGVVLAVTIPQVLNASGRKRIDLLKLDIEGSELDIFTSPDCMVWLSKTRYIFLELHDDLAPGSSNAFYSRMCAFRFSQWSVGESILVHNLDCR
jgi:FkbM family methyltransferase